MGKMRLAPIPEYPRRSDPLREPKIEKRNAIIRRQRMLTFRSVPVKRRVWWVTLTATVTSADQFAPGELPMALTFTPDAFWCLSRRKAKAILARDHASGGSGTMYPVEYRLCAVCSRVLLGPDAHDYRMKQMKPVATWTYPQGPACNMDCKPHGRGPEGRTATYTKHQPSSIGERSSSQQPRPSV